MANKGSHLIQGEYLQCGDYLSSPSGIFYARLYDDGNFCVEYGTVDGYEGTLWCYTESGIFGGQYYARLYNDGNFCIEIGANPEEYKGTKWCYTSSGNQGQFYAMLYDDGNFCIEIGQPGNYLGTKWCVGCQDPVIDVVEITDIEYDIENATMNNTAVDEVFSQTISNASDIEQDQTLSKTISVINTSEWQSAWTGKLGSKTEFQAKIPIVGKGRVEISAEIEKSYSWGESTSYSVDYTFTVTCKSPPHTSIDAITRIAITSITVPYTLYGTLVFKSGKRFKGQIRGVYTGKSSHDLKTVFSSPRIFEQ